MACHHERYLKQEGHEALRRHQTRTVRRCRGVHQASMAHHQEGHLREERHGAFRRHQTQTAWLCRATHKASTERLREYHLYEAFPGLNACPRFPFRTIIAASAEVAAASAGAATASVGVDSAAMAGVVTVVAIGRPRPSYQTTASGNPW